MLEARRALALSLVAAAACGGDAAPEDTGGGGGSGGGQPAEATGTSAAGSSTTATGSTSGDAGATTGSSTGSSSDGGSSSSSESTSTPSACPGGIEPEGLEGICIGEPSVIDPQPAYDVFSYDGIVVSNDAGVTQYRSVDGALVEVSTIELPAAGQDLGNALFFQDGEEIPKDEDAFERLLVTVPDADRLAVIESNPSGVLTTAVLLETGARPMGIGRLWTSGFIELYATANADDGTLSLFAPVALGELGPVATLDVGGRPRDIAWNGEVLGVIDTEASTLTVVTLDGLQIDHLDTYPVPAGPVSVFQFAHTDVGAPSFMVVSPEADAVTVINPGIGVVSGTASFPGGPADVQITRAEWLPDQFDAEEWFWVGAIAMMETSRITIGMYGYGEGTGSLEHIIGDFPCAESPVALVLAYANGDELIDFVTASPTSGLAVVAQG